MDKKDYRSNVGIMVVNKDGKILVCKRTDTRDSQWQMPQGGIDGNENHIKAGYRELKEETTITKEQTEFIDFWDEFQFYDIPKESSNPYKGQKQKWLIVRYIGEGIINLEQAQDHEFKEYKWVSMDEAINLVWKPKKEIYKNLAKRYCLILQDIVIC